MGRYKPTALTKLGHGPGHAKQHRVFVINENPESPDGSIEVGHYGDIYIPRSIYPSYGNPGGEVVDAATYFAEMFHHDMSGFQADFDPTTGFMYPYVGSDEFHASFKPTDISGCVLWLDADAITGLNDDDPVGTWADQSGSSNDFAQATTAKKPTYKTGILNSLPIVRFDGTDDFLSRSAVVGNTDSCTISIIFNVSSTAAHVTVLNSSKNDAATDYMMLRVGSADYKCRFVTDATVAGGGKIATTNELTQSTFALVTWWCDGSDYKIFINSSEETLVAETGADDGLWISDMTGANETDIGAYILNSSYSKYLPGDIAEIVWYDVALSAANRGLVEAYLNSKYAIY